MPVEPSVLAAMQDMPPLVTEGASVADIRAAYRRQCVVEPVSDRLPVGGVEDRTIGADLPIRIYRPQGPGPHPTIVYFHGGGWVFGDLDTHDSPCRALCQQVDAVVVSVDYRLAPEHPFPAGVQDALTATRWVADNLDELGADPARLAVAGDSAGGNFAAVVSQQLLDDGPPIAAQVLFYPTTDVSRRYPSGPMFADGYLLDRRALKLFGQAYLTGPADVTDPRISPLLFDRLGELPPAVVVTSEYDPIRDQGVAYAAALRDAGVRVEELQFAGMIHGFLTMPGVPAARRAIEESFALVRKIL
ncbi:alpha/beta hydrolase [Fodinicola feengrottensis]|uniref:Alpha/beta hydrolase n=1 Tax=Fodinicola feengrottensis TaxID=435914 RepID=A0ABP4TYQ2_9ACTN|nr:alpha/beta hydrolase [Fodinicola feengrottensis]